MCWVGRILKDEMTLPEMKIVEGTILHLITNDPNKMFKVKDEDYKGFVSPLQQ